MGNEIEFGIADTAPVLRPGDQGPWVRYLQELLEVLGRNPHLAHSPLPINEHFGPDTEAAVRQFQAWVPMSSTGIVDHDTWQLLVDNAQSLEYAKTSLGETLTPDADHAKLDAGQEIGRHGWRRVNLHCTVLSFRQRPFHDTYAYARFADTQGAQSDENGHVVSGVLQLNDVWVPEHGEFHLYVRSEQPGPEGMVGDVSGVAAIHATGDFVQFQALQSAGDTRQITQEEADARGWSQQSSVDSGIDLEIAKIGSTIGSGESGEHTSSQSEALTVTFPGNGFQLAQVS
ncbi:MAG: peptidoglycan-binding domain-containing protein [Candidatus Dormiibacterota bacterium]